MVTQFFDQLDPEPGSNGSIHGRAKVRPWSFRVPFARAAGFGSTTGPSAASFRRQRDWSALWLITSASTAQAASQAHQSYQWWFNGWSIGLAVALTVLAGIGLVFLIESIGEPSFRDAVRAEIADRVTVWSNVWTSKTNAWPRDSTACKTVWFS